MYSSIRFFVLMTGSLLVSGCAITDILKDTKTAYSLRGETQDAATLSYLQTILEEQVADKTKALSKEPDILQRQEDYLEQTTRADLLKALYAKGYYSAAVTYKDGAQPFTGTYDISYGPKFTIASIETMPRSYNQYLVAKQAEEGFALDAEKVLAAQTDLYNDIQKGRCYFSLDVKNEVYLDKGRHTGDVDFVVAAGPEGKFGPVTFQGNDSVRESYLRKLVTWKEGDCFRREKIEDYKTVLLQSGLFARAEAVLPEAPAQDGSVPVNMDLRERAQRSISAGLTYYSDEGPGINLGWEHRNLFGAAEKLEAALKVSALNQSLDLDFTKPYFLRNDQSLSLNSALRRQDTDAFEETGADAGVALNRAFTKHFSASTGVDLTLSRITDNTDNTTKTYGLVSAPQSILYDTRDNTLDPHKGWNISANIEPFFDILGESSPFFKTQVTGSGYLAFGTSADIVLASKAGIGSIWGAALDDIPATERFYAGGGGSVRGYGYQEVGPQEDGDPTGGRSLVTGSLELRGKFTETFGGVAFIDAGSVTEASSPEFSDLAIGAGLGIRYYTSFGPIRFDIATPLTQKEDLEQNYQFYISIGQAF